MIDTTLVHFSVLQKGWQWRLCQLLLDQFCQSPGSRSHQEERGCHQPGRSQTNAQILTGQRHFFLARHRTDWKGRHAGVSSDWNLRFYASSSCVTIAVLLTDGAFWGHSRGHEEMQGGGCLCLWWGKLWLTEVLVPLFCDPCFCQTEAVTQRVISR